jgi:hypothetical protein
LTVVKPDFARGSRASAFYSLAKKLWLPWQRRQLFKRAMTEISAMLGARPADPVHSLQHSFAALEVYSAIADYEHAVAIRSREHFPLRSQGEAWTELGWGYLWGLRFAKAQAALRKGIGLMRQDVAASRKKPAK